MPVKGTIKRSELFPFSLEKDKEDTQLIIVARANC
jgi:hypothetical protein